MLTKTVKKRIDYTGEQLCSLWGYKNWGVLGDSIIAFVGSAHVQEMLVDQEDVRAKAYIYSPLMLHLIVEHFDITLTETIVRQRLLIAIISELLLGYQIKAKRKGDDIYVNNKKLSVSIATASPISTLIHIGLNIETNGTPVPTAGIKQMGIDEYKFASEIMRLYKSETEEINKARRKVIGVA